MGKDGKRAKYQKIKYGKYNLGSLLTLVFKTIYQVKVFFSPPGLWLAVGDVMTGFMVIVLG